MKYYLYSKKDEGPFSKEELALFGVTNDDLVKEESTDYWIEIAKVPELCPLTDVSISNDIIDQIEGEECAGEAEIEPESHVDYYKDSAIVKTDEPTENTRFGLRKWLIVLPLFILFVAYFTNPGKKAHFPVVRNIVERVVGPSKSGITGDPFFDMFFDNFGIFDNMMTERVMNEISWHDGHLFSYCSFTDNSGNSHWITFGCLGVVYSMNEGALKQFVYGDDKVKHKSNPSEKPKKKKENAPSIEDGVTL